MNIINVRPLPPNAPGVVYCGRATRNGWRASPLGNPFTLRPGVSRESVLARYRAWLLGRIAEGDAAVIAALEALTDDSVLGCWCRPLSCHCDVIVEVWEGKR